MTCEKIMLPFQLQNLAVNHKHHPDFRWLLLLTINNSLVDSHNAGMKLVKLLKNCKEFWRVGLSHFDFCPEKFDFADSFDNKLFQFICDFLKAEIFDAKLVGMGWVSSHNDLLLLNDYLLERI